MKLTQEQISQRESKLSQGARALGALGASKGGVARMKKYHPQSPNFGKMTKPKYPIRFI